MYGKCEHLVLLYLFLINKCNSTASFSVVFVPLPTRKSEVSKCLVIAVKV